MEIKLKKLYTDTKIPIRAKQGDAAYDCFVHHFVKYNKQTEKLEDIFADYHLLNPHKIIGCALGFATAIPVGYYANIVPRSGLALKQDIVAVLGTIDAGYRGEWIAIISNVGENQFQIKRMDRICQIMVKKIEEYTFIESDQLPISERGEGGFGSTGK